MLEVVPFNYNEVNDDIVQRFKDKGYDADVAGSNAAILSSIISHTISMLNTNIAFNTSELLLSSATKETNILSIARQMGYEAQQKISYQYQITLQAKIDSTKPVDSPETSLYEVPKYSKFTNGSNSYYYMGPTIRKYISNKQITDNNENSYVTINIKEGNLRLQTDYPDILTITTTTTLVDNEIQTQNFIDIPLTSVEDDGIELFLTYIDEYGVEHIDEPWTKTTQFLIDKDTDLSNKFMRLEDIDNKTPRCYFALAGIGNQLRLGTVIKANVLISNGATGSSVGNVAVSSPLSDTFALYDGVVTEKNQRLIVSGQEAESTDSIKLNAPLFHNSANRAVTKYDYIAICNRNSLVQLTQCWGGDEELPIRLGHIFFSMTPSYKERVFANDALKNTFVVADRSATNLMIKDTELRSTSYDEFGNLTNPGVFDTLDDFKIMTMQLHHRQPVYINFDYTVSIVQYNLRKSKQDINQSAFDIINSYFSANMEEYETHYYHSNIIKRIDTELSDLTGVTITLNTTISLYKENIISERDNVGEQQFTFFLASPFESYLNGDGTINSLMMPSIDTANSIVDGYNLYIDWTNPHSVSGNTDLTEEDHFWFDIKFGDSTAGRYYVQNKTRKHIRIDLYLDGAGAEDETYTNSLLTPEMFNTERLINIKYHTPNFKVYKNTLPRLTSVSFV